jgi:hypothetical protein
MKRWYLANTFATVSLSGAQALGFDGEHLWVGTSGNTVSKVNSSTGAIVSTTATTGASAVNVAFDGLNIWVAYRNSSSLVKIQASTGAVLANVAVGQQYSVAFDGRHIYTGTVSNTVQKIDPSTNAVVASAPRTTVTEIMPTEFGLFVLSCDAAGGLIKLDPNTLAAVSTVPFVFGCNAAFDGENFWVVAGTQLSKVRASDGTILATFPISGSGPIVFDGNHVWISPFGGLLTKIKTRDGVTVGTFPNVGAQDLVFDGANVWAANPSGILSKR